MNLDLGGAVQTHFVENGTMIFKLLYTSLHHILFQGINDYKLVRMHRNSYVVLFYKITDFSEFPPKMTGPVIVTNGM
jgi:hypothetical protein